jgi:hypothetical protein
MSDSAFAPFERKVRKDLIRGRKRRRGIKNIDQKLAEAQGDGACYQYGPLDPSDKEIRLLTLHPGSPNEEIRVDITYSSLHDRPRYLARSYVWGAVERIHPLLVNGNWYYVTQNLLYALQHLRNMRGPDCGIPFWIDALCIDQDDEEEKSHQVILMREIYSQAYKVLVWLGPPSEESEMLLARMRAMKACLYLVTFSMMGREEREGEKKTELAQTEAWNPRHDNSDGYYEQPFVTHRPDEPNQLDTRVAIANFLENGWWERVWIAQEVSCPVSSSTRLGNVEIIMGMQLQTVSFRSTFRLLGFLIRLGLLEPKYSASGVPSAFFVRLENAQMRISTLDRIVILRKRYRPVSQRVVMAIAHAFGNKQRGPTADQLFWTLTVRKILHEFRGLKCSNPRDKIYAALPLVLSSTHSVFAPNYELSVADVYIQMALSFLYHENSLSILADGSQMDTEIPSWVPDYRNPRRTYSLCTLLDKNYRPIYRASGDLEAKYTFATETYSQSRSSLPPEAGAEVHEPKKKPALLTRHTLTVRGVMLDKNQNTQFSPLRYEICPPTRVGEAFGTTSNLLCT